MTSEIASVSVTGGDLRFAGGRITVDLAALAANYRALAQICAPAAVAGVVKADAYGLGVAEIVPTLLAEGCSRFFVALPEEGCALRAIAPGATIFVMNGLFSAEATPAYADFDLIPVLNSAAEIAIWETFCGVSGARRPCALNIDTGMHRLGLSPAEALAFAEENDLTRALNPVMVMSHLACADDPQNAMNRRQLQSFQALLPVFGNIESSLANSAGILLGRDYHLGLTRPGIAVYGGAPLTGGRNPMRTVVTAEARVAQVRHAKAGETVSYGATAVLDRDTVVAVAAVGYADGYHRAGSGSGVALREIRPGGGQGFIHGQRAPVLGRITMDLTMFDVTDIVESIAVRPGDYIELFGPNIPLDEAAEAAGTISYEMLTSLGRRYHRRYLAAPPAAEPSA
jgi:alanine racemase